MCRQLFLALMHDKINIFDIATIFIALAHSDGLEIYFNMLILLAKRVRLKGISNKKIAHRFVEVNRKNYYDIFIVNYSKCERVCERGD